MFFLPLFNGHACAQIKNTRSRLIISFRDMLSTLEKEEQKIQHFSKARGVYI